MAEIRAETRPRVLFVGRSRYRLPLPEWVAKKWDAIEDVLDYRVVGAAEPGSPTRSERFRLQPPGWPRRLDGALFHLRLPFLLRGHLRQFRPHAIVAADPFVGAAALLARRLASSRSPVIVEVHGDWRTFTRGYGSPARRLLSPLADRVANAAVRRADATRALSSFTSRLVEEVRGEPATAAFPTYSDLSAFAEPSRVPLPDRPVAVFVGMLEAYKNVDGLARAWRRVAAELPQARLIVIGDGSRRHVVDELVADLPAQVEHHLRLLPAEVAAKLDESVVLVLPSWPEGLGRVVIEAFARARGVIATSAAGVADLVDDGVEGILIPRADTDALASALVSVLTDRELALSLSQAAGERYDSWHSTPQDFAQRLRELVDAVLRESSCGSCS